MATWPFDAIFTSYAAIFTAIYLCVKGTVFTKGLLCLRPTLKALTMRLSPGEQAVALNDLAFDYESPVLFR